MTAYKFFQLWCENCENEFLVGKKEVEHCPYCGESEHDVRDRHKELASIPFNMTPE